MGLIFAGSTDALSDRNTSRLLGPVLRWLIPGVSDETVRRVQVAVRKAAHVAEYAVLSMLVFRAADRSQSGGGGRTVLRPAVFAVLFAAAYAVTDEYHQSLVATRFGSPWDVVYDTAGAMGGVVLVWGWRRVRGRPMV
jgi:VanZ family protein